MFIINSINAVMNYKLLNFACNIKIDAILHGSIRHETPPVVIIVVYCASNGQHS